MSNNLIERYVTEVGKHLFTKNRGDIQKELRSTLEDMLEDRSQAAGRAADEEMTVALLKEFGRPEKVAASYQPNNQLIGPQLYPFYLLVLKIVLPIVSAVLLVTSLAGLALARIEPGQALVEIGQALLGIFNAVISAVGGITIIFAILDRVPGFRSEFEKDRMDEEKDWNPRHLPEVREGEKFSISNLVVEIIGAAAMLVLFNFYPQVVGIHFLMDGSWTSVPLLSEAFFEYLPFLSILWGLTLLLDVSLLSRGRWETWSRWVSLLLKVATIALAGVMLGGPSLVSVDAGALAATGLADLLTVIVQQAVIVALALTILSNLVTVLRLLVRLSGKNLSPALEKFAHP